MVRIGIAEDDQGYIDQLQGYLSEYQKETGETFRIQVFRDGMQLAFDDQPVYDILLLDVVLTEKSLYCGDGSGSRAHRQSGDRGGAGLRGLSDRQPDREPFRHPDSHGCGDGSHDRGRRAPVKRKNMPRPMSEKPRTKRSVRSHSPRLRDKNPLGSPE